MKLIPRLSPILALGLALVASAAPGAPADAAYQPRFSTAGFYPEAGTGRSVYSLNIAWRFLKADAAQAEAKDFDDRPWAVVSLPHGLETLPVDASGCVNYQGPAWYRKHFTPDPALKGRKLFLHFEGIMGKSQVWVNGTRVAEHFGGYLPVIADVSQSLKWGEDNVIAVRADNSDDPLYPPGKPQASLDFCYFGGIYRDVWLVAHNGVFITDPNYENETAGGGVLVSYEQVSAASAGVNLKIHLRNDSGRDFSGTIEWDWVEKTGTVAQHGSAPVRLAAGTAGSTSGKMTVTAPKLWSPESPYLYSLCLRVKDAAGAVQDGYRLRTGIRGIEFKQAYGLWLNGKPYQDKLIGANRHQDFAVVGNALANSTHWRDAKKLRDAGMKVIRTAHCPPDPAFMDACDELGLLVLLNTPGWQFWNKNPVFGERVYQDIRNLVRQNRNHAALFFWEPVLNETSYPADFAKRAAQIVAEEFPYPYSTAACDDGADGAQYFPLLLRPRKEMDPAKTYFIREWGDNVDDWMAQNSNSRVNRGWGETPMLIQAAHYATEGTSLNSIHASPRQIVGGTFWHSFDHQRGYHPVPFLGGIMDAFRQPKYAYYLFQAQRSPEKSDLLADSGPMVFIAHEMSPFSPKDVTVYSNCEKVRLTFLKNGKSQVYVKAAKGPGMPAPVITFKDVFDFMACKSRSRGGHQDEVYLLAEGLIGDQVVATHQVFPAGRAEKVVVWLDHEGVDLVANGSDFVTVIAGIADKSGRIKRLNTDAVKFTIEGEGRLLGGSDPRLNPRPFVWGTAPMLVQATTRPGKIRVIAQVLNAGSQRPVSGELAFNSVPDAQAELFSVQELADLDRQTVVPAAGEAARPQSELERENETLRQELNRIKLKEVEKQQNSFGQGIN